MKPMSAAAAAAARVAKYGTSFWQQNARARAQPSSGRHGRIIFHPSFRSPPSPVARNMQISSYKTRVYIYILSWAK